MDDSFLESTPSSSKGNTSHTSWTLTRAYTESYVHIYAIYVKYCTRSAQTPNIPDLNDDMLLNVLKSSVMEAQPPV